MEFASYGSEGDGFSAQIFEQQNPTEVLKSMMSDECDVCQNEQLVQQVNSGTTDFKSTSIILCSPRFSI